MAGPNTLMKCANQQRTWFQEKDNAYAAGNPPPFLGQNMINIDEDTSYSFFYKTLYRRYLSNDRILD